MPKKTDRPIRATVFPASGSPWLKVTPLSVEKDELEREVVKRFVVALERLEGESLECTGKATEPGDVTIARQTGETIHVQLGEVVDSARIRTNERRAEYGTAIWESYPELQEAYAGIQVAILDAGDAFDLPRVHSSKGKLVLDELANELRKIIPIVQSLPTNAPGERKGKETRIQIPAVAHHVTVRLLKYSAEPSSPVQWLWTGTHRVGEPTLNRGFTDLMRKKLSHYGSISGPFWLVLYSLDCQCDDTEEAALLSQLDGHPHHFDEVFLFFPRHGNPGEVRRLYPLAPAQTPADSEPRKKVLAELLPEDAVPKWDDPRWRSPS